MLSRYSGVSLGCFATKDIAAILRRDEQLANRFELMTLSRWQLDDTDYAKLLATFAQVLPFRRPSYLTDPGLAQALLVAAGRLIGGIASLLRQAAVEAIRTGHECIDRSCSPMPTAACRSETQQYLDPAGRVIPTALERSQPDWA